MRSEDFDDHTGEAEWLDAARGAAEEYLAREEVRHGGIASRPDWFLAPYVAVWSVESERVSGRRGWWVVTGDLPSDYVSSRDAETVRDALRAFASRWLGLASRMARGEPDPEVRIGDPEQWPELAPLLQSRAQMLDEIANDATLWTETS